MEYAAIIIPTLNRYEHLKRCIDSLLSCDEARVTDVYISVDYPPSEKYKKGYPEVLNYVKTISGFSSVNIFYQESNLGPGLNRKFLEEKISKTHDKYVFTDDDNEFSNNFLAYVNWGLEYFKDDESVYAICSCTDFDVEMPKDKADYFMVTAYNPYGAGHWLHKNKKCGEYLCEESLKRTYKSKERQRLLLQYSPMVYMWVAQDSIRNVSAMRGKNDAITYIDIWENYYIIENSMKCVKPILPKSRNWGLDGSGVHSNEGEKSDYTPNIELDSSRIWSDKPIRMVDDTELLNEERHKEKFDISQYEKKKYRRLYVLNSFWGNKFVYMIYKIIKSVFKKNKDLDSNSKIEVKYG